MAGLIKLKKTEKEALEGLGIKEWEDQGDYFYMLHGKKVETCARFSFDIQVTKSLNKKGVEFSVDTQSSFKLFKTFSALMDFLKTP